MKFIAKLLLCTSISMSAPIGALAQSSASIGELDNVSGSVLIERGGEFLRTTSDSAVIAGDRIVTFDGGQADVTLNGCSVSIPDLSSVAVSESRDCKDLFVTTPLEIGDPARQASLASLELEGGSSILIALLAASAVVAGIVIIADDNEPTSP